MKKIFSLFAAVLMAGGMMAGVKSDTIKWNAAVAQANLAASYASPTNADFVFNQVGGNSVDGSNTKFGTADVYDQYAFRFKAGGATGTSRTFSLSIPEAGTLKVAARTASSSNENRTLTLKQDGATLVATGLPNDQTVGPATDGKGTVFSYVEVEVEAGTVGVEVSAAINFYGFILETEEAPASEPMRVYCKMEYGWWKTDGAAVGIHYWGGEGATNWPGVRMTPVDGVADTWYFDLDTTQNHNVIFTRVNGSGEIADWGAQTKNLTVPTDGKNLFTITSSTAVWGGEVGCDGEWSVYGTEPGPGPEPEPEVIDTLYLVNSKGWGSPKIYFYGGKKGQRTAWPGDAMTKVNGVQADGFDVYMFSINHGDHANVIFNNGGSVQSGDLVIAGNEGKYFNFADQTWYESAEAVVCTWYLNANYNGTTEWREMTRGEGTFTRRDVYAAATNYYYNGMAADNLKSEIKGAKLTIDSKLAAGDSALFTLDPYAKTIKVTKIAVTKDTAMYVAGNFTNWAAEMQELPYSVTLPKDSTIEFKQVCVITTTSTVAGQEVASRDTIWCGQANEGAYMTRENIAAGWLLDGAYNVLLKTDAAGQYTFLLNADGTFMVTFPSATTGLWNTDAEEVQKAVVDGKVVIIKNGVKYNVVGLKY